MTFQNHTLSNVNSGLFNELNTNKGRKKSPSHKITLYLSRFAHSHSDDCNFYNKQFAPTPDH